MHLQARLGPEVTGLMQRHYQGQSQLLCLLKRKGMGSLLTPKQAQPVVCAAATAAG